MIVEYKLIQCNKRAWPRRSVRLSRRYLSLLLGAIFLRTLSPQAAFFWTRLLSASSLALSLFCRPPLPPGSLLLLVFLLKPSLSPTSFLSEAQP